MVLMTDVVYSSAVEGHVNSRQLVQVVGDNNLPMAQHIVMLILASCHLSSSNNFLFIRIKRTKVISYKKD